MKTMIATFVIVVAVLWFLVLLWLVYGRSWRRVWCHTFHRGCDWSWQSNEPRYLPGQTRPLWIGRYQCQRCLDWSDGCARWEQQARQLGTPGDEHADVHRVAF
jgi:hypothetical protein